MSARPQIILSELIDPFNTTAAPNNEYTLITDTNDVTTAEYYVILSWGPDRAQDITAIDSNGNLTVTGDADEDIYITNGARQ